MSAGQANHNTEPMSVLAGLWTKAQPVVSAFICCSVRDFHDAEDLLQQVAQAAAHKFHEYDREKPFTPWVIGIARHKLLEYFRKHNRDRHIFDHEAIAQLAGAYQDLASDLDEMKEALEHCLSKTNPRWLQVLEMRYIRDMKPARIAQQIGTTASTVSVMLNRVRNALANCIRGRIATGKESL